MKKYFNRQNAAELTYISVGIIFIIALSIAVAFFFNDLYVNKPDSFFCKSGLSMQIVDIMFMYFMTVFLPGVIVYLEIEDLIYKTNNNF